eukprot:scaffold20892_cov112-Isochrysis_galbana.AAC.3
MRCSCSCTCVLIPRTRTEQRPRRGPDLLVLGARISDARTPHPERPRPGAMRREAASAPRRILHTTHAYSLRAHTPCNPPLSTAEALLRNICTTCF